ncbi:MAG: cellulose biosynthesis cyclic di-GMP-binding regulatory protein BcsB [Chloroflexi bacterium]|nr:cellulose biosynthesis cyclic di-GMP-binding regulatory protein BcsB [Chloroflexota bacterium]
MLNLKKAHFVVFIFAILFSFPGGSRVFASSARQDEVNLFTFADLGVESDIVLKGPFESRTIRFDLPPNWELRDGAELNLEISAYFASSELEQQSTAGNTFTGALLDVFFNDGLQKSVPLTNTENTTYRIPISAKDLKPTGADGSYFITLVLDAAIDCDFEFHKTTIVVKNNSYVILPRSEVSLELDLRRLPWPLYQERTNIASTTLMVLPDSPSADEMQAGFTAMGAFGRMTSGRLPITFLRYSELTEEQRLNSDLIFVGKPSAFPILSDLALSLKVLNGSFSSTEVGAEDGVLQIIASPWNPSKSVLLVSGASDGGVVKAAQALSSGDMQTGLNPSYSVVAQVNPFVIADGQLVDPQQPAILSPDVNFDSLGYPAVTLDSLGPNYFTYEFNIPVGLVPSESPYAEFHFSNSSLVDPVRSDFAVYLNDTIVGSVQLTEGTSSFTTAKIDLPASLLKSGLNRLDLVVTLIPRDECSMLAFSGLWATIFSDSFFHLSLIPSPEPIALFRDLKSYPYPFAADTSFRDTTFVISKNDPISWPIAARIAYDLGARVDGNLLGYEVAFDGEIPEQVKQGHIILVGTPKELSILDELSDAMPARFEPGSNIAVLETQIVIYRISDQKSLGYLEIFVSPWSEKAAVLGVFGTNLTGLDYALNSIINFQIRETLSGNFSTYDGGNRAIIVDTRTGLGLGRFESSLGTENVDTQPATDIATPVEAAGAPVNNMRNMIMVGIIVIIVVMAAVVLVALRFSKRRL